MSCGLGALESELELEPQPKRETIVKCEMGDDPRVAFLYLQYVAFSSLKIELGQSRADGAFGSLEKTQ